MKFLNYELNNNNTVIGIEISPKEYFDQARTSGLLQRFEASIMNRLAMMVAGYYFKKHKDEIIAAINIEDVNKMISDEIKRRLMSNLLKG